MKIENLKVGQRVNCPSDRGQNSYTGTIESLGCTVSTNIFGVKYVWVTVSRTVLFGESKRSTVWPSNRLATI